ncbi:hypothetical protein CMO96_03925 [Candidatus Woesebacteria bacterium]|nr:hypothetical protein [Candidatus Woesebacteria bacterium]
MLLSNDLLVVGLALCLVWLLGISIWIYRTSSHYNRLIGKAGRENLKFVLEKALVDQGKLEEYIKKVEGSLSNLQKSSLAHIQKTGVVRFNPFTETGGDQSFALALLDGQDSGFVILSLHGREGTRIYVKPVRGGKSRYELSREEKQAVSEATVNKKR